MALLEIRDSKSFLKLMLVRGLRAQPYPSHVECWSLNALHMLPPYACTSFGFSNSRSPLLKGTSSFYLLIHFLCCSLHFFEDVCITKYNPSVKGGMASSLHLLLSFYWKYIVPEIEPMDVFILFSVNLWTLVVYYYCLFSISFHLSKEKLLL